METARRGGGDAGVNRVRVGESRLGISWAVKTVTRCECVTIEQGPKVGPPALYAFVTRVTGLGQWATVECLGL